MKPILASVVFCRPLPFPSDPICSKRREGICSAPVPCLFCWKCWAMAPSKKLGVWLKRRLNPPKKDGSRTVSYTLQWRDEDFEERFKSLGADLTEEEAEIKRAEFDDFLNGDYGDDPQRFVDQMTERRRRGMEKLKLLAGADPRQWPFLKMFG